MFRAGKKDSPEDYNGGRTASDLVAFAKNAAGSGAPKARPVVQVTSQATLDEQCKDKASLCLLAFLPHILDGGAKARVAALETLKSVATKQARRPFSYVWLEAGSQPGIEEALLAGNNFYPSVVALNLKKQRYAPMVGSFSPDSIGSFMAAIMSGKEPTSKLNPDSIVAKDTPAWDGKDGAPPQEEKDL